MPTAVASSQAARTRLRDYRPHTVQQGETLSSMANEYGLSRQELLNFNPDIWDPDNIPPGFIIRIPVEVINGNPTGGTQGTSANQAPTSSVVNGVRLPAYPKLERYAPNSREAIQLFTAAATLAGLPTSWASAPGLHHIIRRESDGWIGRPNYTYGRRHRDHSQWESVHAELRRGRKTARSSATGIGQLLLSNVDAYYPDGRAGIGDPLNEAVGMLKYIKARYGSPARAWERYGVNHEGY